jgi:sulfonate transport system ATP-binding protein
VLLVTHDVDEAIGLADRVLVLVEGQLAVDQPIDLPAPRSHREPRFLELRDLLLSALGVASEADARTDLHHPSRTSLPTRSPQ